MPQNELPKTYDPKQVEDRIYGFWLEKNYFHAEPNPDKTPYTIVIPPPNVTDRLHMGHAYNNTIQDMIIRFKKMRGFETLWMPGTDHAGIATQTVMERSLKKEGKSRYDVGREKFVELTWEWKEKHGSIIINQLKKLGCACDWERERFTMDEGLSKAVELVFIKLYDKGLIYKGNRIVNWDPASATALSDDEVEFEEVQGKLYHIRYKLKDSDEFITVATTRPETLLGDTGVAIALDDEAKQRLIGKTVIIPFVNREVTIFADEHVDKEFGTGFVKATPAHDPNDFDMGKRHGLAQVIMLDHDARILPVCQVVEGTERKDELPVPEFLAGLDRFEARKKIVAALEEMGQIEKIEEYTHSVGHSYRSKVPIEPYLSEQWFVKMKPLAEAALEAVTSGKIKLYPEGKWDRTYAHWMTNVRDWCISRQLWWGHRIPVWYNDNGDIKVCADDPSTPGDRYKQDPDVLDTWFSSQLWPFSTLGWPEKNADLDYFYPTNTLVTGPDIIFFWVARMIMAGLEFMGDIPFDSVYFNGIIRDVHGKKMSKTLGNGIDPLAMIDKYSADAVRYSLLALSSEGQDINLAIKDFEIGRNFSNKLWNAFRFVAMNLEDGAAAKANLAGIQELREKSLLDLADEWILSRYSETVIRITAAMEKFKFHDVNSALHSFFWGEFCDWYLELIKPRLFGDDAARKQATQATAVFALRGLLRLLHPIIPFITEEIWQQIGAEVSESIMLTDWPESEAVFADRDVEARMALLQAAIMAVRNIRGELNVPPQKYADVLISGADADTAELLQTNMAYFSHLARISSVQASAHIERPKLSATSVVRKLEIFMPLEGLIDIDVERQRLSKEKTRLEGQVSGLQRKLQNKDFLAKAPQQVVENEQRKLNDFKLMLEKIEANLAQLAG